ncbi:vitelline membrane outer layer protein 1 homolog isoform X2 [Homarus americanus]|uniref:vitelline membrane outer layer protein 1 homolog isoform X2 n=1 Tax=Homarus americanus TaxID=6706 RepID=UPI001C448105|nr:vitelline membrane outer layer protein 1 homolog isoform X2 [Homarus americanus]
MSTLVFLLSLLALGSGAPGVKEVVESLKVDNGLGRGKWGSVDLCPSGSYVFAFEIKFEPAGHVDETAMNGIKMYCKDVTGTLTGYTISSEGVEGEWQGLRSCNKGEYLQSLRGNVMPEQGTFHDDLGMYNFQMNCSDGQTLDGLNDTYHPPAQEKNEIKREILTVDGREMEAIFLTTKITDDGVWSSWASCTGNNRICGHQSRVQTNSIADDAGLCDVIMFCCSF